jgi:phenylpyruvate tautomerase PptA (4-oxalocrotonate tautomerase family)
MPAEENAVPAETQQIPDTQNSMSLGEEDDVHCLSDVLPGANASSSGAAAEQRRAFALKTWENVKVGGWNVFLFMQGIGEVIASILGLNESKFQYVIDNMSDEDWKIAREVQARREREQTKRDAAAANKPINDMEGAVEPTTGTKVKSLETEAAVER